MHFLITAGGTREYIDPVRFISNASSGKMGYALAAAAVKSGHKVTLVTTTDNLELRIKNFKLKTIVVKTAEQMFKAVKRNFSKCDCLIMAAAVADYTTIKKSKTKIQKSGKNLIIKLKPTIDILAWAGKHKRERRATSYGPRFIVGFALEDKNLRRNAERKLTEKNLDMIIANTPKTIGSDLTQVHYKTANGKWRKSPQVSKQSIAGKLIKVIEKLY